MKPFFELRRQIAHVLFGLSLIILFYYFNIPFYTLLILFFVSVLFSIIVKKINIPILHQFLRIFEREKHIKKFPGRGFIFFVLGAYLSFILFEKNIALTSILILTLGDAFTNLIGFYFGKRIHILNKKKTIEGSIGGAIVSFMGANFFVPIIPAIAASIVAMIIEAPQWKIGRIEIDDNILIPISAGIVLSLF